MQRMRFLLMATLLLSVHYSSRAQSDTLQNCPFLYLYNWQGVGTYHDTSLCSVYETYPINYNYSSSFLSRQREVAFFQGNEGSLKAIGFACFSLNGNYVALYDENMVKLAEKDTLQQYDFSIFPPCGSELHEFILPGLSISRSARFYHLGEDSTTRVLLAYHYFDEPVIVKGNFYLSAAGKIALPSGDTTYTITPSILSVVENHNPPYHRNPVYFRTFDLVGTHTWTSLDTTNFLPYFFLLIEPECKAVENVQVTTDSAGCIRVEWDTLRYQRHWALRLNGPSDIRYDTVDVPFHTYCGLNPNANYIVSIQTQCYRPPDTLYWGSWSNGFPLNNNDISEASVIGSLQISPNPATEQVTITAEGYENVDKMSVFDVAGTEVLHCEGVHLPYNLSVANLPVGVYMLQVTTGKLSTTQKLVVRR